MREYTHNNVRVTYQMVEDGFINALNANGMYPEELPIDDFRYRVFKYTYDGSIRYAAVIQTIAPDACLEKVYITTSIPEDGFYEMMLDIEGQKDGDEPQKIKSRLSIAISKAEESADNWVKEQFPDEWKNCFFTGYTEKLQKEYDTAFGIALNSFGYDINMLDKINAPDIDKEDLKKKLK